MAGTKGTQKYSARITKSKDQHDKEEAELNVADASAQLDADIVNAKREVMKFAKKVEAAKNACPFSSRAIISAERELLVAERDVTDLVALKSELF